MSSFEGGLGRITDVFSRALLSDFYTNSSHFTQSIGECFLYVSEVHVEQSGRSARTVPPLHLLERSYSGRHLLTFDAQASGWYPVKIDGTLKVVKGS